MSTPSAKTILFAALFGLPACDPSIGSSEPPPIDNAPEPSAPDAGVVVPDTPAPETTPPEAPPPETPPPPPTAVEIEIDEVEVNPAAFAGYCPVTLSVTAELVAYGGAVEVTYAAVADGLQGPAQVVALIDGEPQLVAAPVTVGSPGNAISGEATLVVLAPEPYESEADGFRVACMQ